GSAAAYALILFLYVFIFAFAFVKITRADLGASVEKKRRKGGRLSASVFLPGWRRGTKPASGVVTEAAGKENRA
ncbi:ABC sugar transporter, permease protein, partial [human gut metagenome]